VTPRPASDRPALPLSLDRLRLRWLVLAITLAGMLSFLAIAVVDQRAAPIALAGALLVALKGLGWLLVLRHYRRRLRVHGFRW
jgi:hypothetical protein